MDSANLEVITARWLHNTQSSELNRHLESRAPGTGLWLWETDRYRKWYESPGQGSLWIKGPPGSGKTVLAASLVQHLQETENKDIPVLFFFFRHSIYASRYPEFLLQDWLAVCSNTTAWFRKQFYPYLRMHLKVTT